MSNLSFLSKVVERCGLQQFNEHCKTFHLMPDCQSADRKFYSTETSLIKLTNDILWAMENKSISPVTVMDLSAAFGTSDHNLLLQILNLNFGITDTALSWYSNYIQPCWLKPCVNDSYSAARSQTFSVPTASCSGANISTAYCSHISEVYQRIWFSMDLQVTIQFVSLSRLMTMNRRKW